MEVKACSLASASKSLVDLEKPGGEDSESILSWAWIIRSGPSSPVGTTVASGGGLCSCPVVIVVVGASSLNPVTSYVWEMVAAVHFPPLSLDPLQCSRETPDLVWRTPVVES